MAKEHVALCRCFYCHEPNEILLARRYRPNGEPVHDLSKYNNAVISLDPCQKCQDYMRRGVILITIDDTKSDANWQHVEDGGIPNPWRSGGFFVVSEDFVKRVFKAPMLDLVLKVRWAFLEHVAAEQLGLFAAAKEQPA
jgi:hypothetical protein